jgi:CrcB protein
MLWNFLLVAVGGAVGSCARYGLNLALPRGVTPGVGALPWGTLGANVLGCFCIGLFTEWAGSKFGMSPETRLLLTTGFCGGFTTLSTLMLEMNTFFRDGEWLSGGLYLALSLAVPFVALWAGVALVKALEQL